ncbi:hypothetical protein KFL01_31790 [Kocuria flava]|uniref:Uncharacterized protein n=1 Tax=Kocuria flava TaxID=446860 RepID=A0ABQ0X8C4_9MICC|nr:hypothetical protein KFL01_31790 [Kocuria flava]
MKEVCVRSIGEDLRTTNAAELDVTRAVRRLAADAKADIDAAILAIVADDYQGISLRLNTTAEAEHTRQQINTAFTREWVNDPKPQHGRTSVVLI